MIIKMKYRCYGNYGSRNAAIVLLEGQFHIAIIMRRGVSVVEGNELTKRSRKPLRVVFEVMRDENRKTPKLVQLRAGEQMQAK